MGINLITQSNWLLSLLSVLVFFLLYFRCCQKKKLRPCFTFAFLHHSSSTRKRKRCKKVVLVRFTFTEGEEIKGDFTVDEDIYLYALLCLVFPLSSLHCSLSRSFFLRPDSTVDTRESRQREVMVHEVKLFFIIQPPSVSTLLGNILL